MEIHEPPVKRRRVKNLHLVNNSENKEPNLHSQNEITSTNMDCLEEAPSNECIADISNGEIELKHDETFSNVKESKMEGSHIEQESNKIVTEGSQLTFNEDRSHPIDENTEMKTDVVHSVTNLDAVKETSSEVKSEDNGHLKSRKKLLVLDVNGLLVDIVVEPDEDYKADTYISGKAVFKRPYCDEFLKFCFERFSVGVWTSRNKRNIEWVLKFLLKDTQHDQLLFCWDQSHCTKTGHNTIENTEKPLVLKELKKLWDNEDSSLPWDKGVYNESNTFLLDDSPYKALRNPPYTAIFPYTYSYFNTKDTGLGPNGDLRKYLERLAESENVQKFIEQNPYGQLPISCDNNEEWKFYQKVIGENSSLIPKADVSIFRKKLLVIDIGGLLAEILKLPRESYKAEEIKQYKPDTILESRAVFKRPYVDEFLQFCFERFKVGVWTSTPRYSMERAVDFLMRDSQHKLVFRWDQTHCTDTGHSTVENYNRKLLLKEIRKLWEKKDPSLPWEIGDYDDSNTLILETSPSRALLNPAHTAIFPSPYRYWNNTEDNSLGPEGDIRKFLERLAVCENVKKFVEENPFGGQRSITPKNLSWKFYEKIIRKFSSKPEADVITLPTNLEHETNTSSAVPTTLEPEAKAVTVTTSTLPTNLEPEADIITLPTNLEPETNTSSTVPTTLEPQEDDSNDADVAQTLLETNKT